MLGSFSFVCIFSFGLMLGNWSLPQTLHFTDKDTILSHMSVYNSFKVHTDQGVVQLDSTLCYRPLRSYLLPAVLSLLIFY